MIRKKIDVDYFCLAVRRNYEPIWRILGRFETAELAQAELDQRRAYTGAFNYDNAELRVMTRAEAKAEFGADWEYHTIGEALPPPRAKRVSKKVVAPTEN